MAAQLIVALDLPRKEDALVLARELQGAVPWCKVGMELFTLAGPDIIRELHDLGFHVFLDMKFYDIPHTVAQAVKAAAAAGAELLTLHCQGGERMCSEARIAADSYGSKAPRLFGVTALTSFGPGEMPGIRADPSDFALELAGKARGWGLDGVVCSGHEAARIKASCQGLRYFSSLVGGCLLNKSNLMSGDVMVFHQLAFYLTIYIPLIRFIST